MTTHDREAVISAAKEAGIYPFFLGGQMVSTESLERFYAIAFEAGRQAEREECAQECGAWGHDQTIKAAEAIRTRSTKLHTAT